MKPIAIVVNNNQAGWLNIVETEPHVTLDVGTELFTRAQVEEYIKTLGFVDAIAKSLKGMGHDG